MAAGPYPRVDTLRARSRRFVSPGGITKLRERRNGTSAGADKPRLRLVPSLPGGGEESRIRVVVVDDHPLLRDAIRMACAPVDSIEIVGEAATGPGAIEACARYTPDVVILDVGLPGLSGFDVARALKSNGSRTKILVLTGSGEHSALFEARRIGVDAFVEKDLSITQIPETILDVASGKRASTTQQERRTNQHLASMMRPGTSRSGRPPTRRSVTS